MAKVYNPEQIEHLLHGIFVGTVNVHNLPKGLYKGIADHLKKGLYEGFGKINASVTFGAKDEALLAELRSNIYIFSAAKTFHFVKDVEDSKAIQQSMIEGDRILSFSEWKKTGLEIFKQYNEDWLKSEYNTTIAMARNAKAWNTFQKEKDKYQFLRYNAVKDENTCDICEPLDGITLPVDDPQWDSITPENHYNCRCFLEQYSEDEINTEDEK